jgi:hypothetical protein
VGVSTVELPPASDNPVVDPADLDRADEAGSVITFPDIEVHGGQVGIYYYRSAAIGLGNLFVSVESIL